MSNHESNQRLSSESEKEYNSALTDEFVAGLSSMPGLDGVTNNSCNRRREMKDVVEEVLTSESDKQFVADSSFIEELCKIDYNTKNEAIQNTDTVVEKPQMNNRFTNDVVGEVLTSESDKEYAADSDIMEEIRTIDLDNLHKTVSPTVSSVPQKKRQVMESNPDSKPIQSGTYQPETIKRMQIIDSKQDSKPCANKKPDASSTNNSAHAHGNNDEVDTAVSSKRRKLEKLPGTAVVTPNKIQQPIETVTDRIQLQADNNVVINETLRSIRNAKYNSVLKGENAYLNNLILSMEKSFFVKGRVVGRIPMGVKSLNQRVLFEKGIYYECHKNRENFLKKIDSMRNNKKSKNPYNKEYRILQGEEALIPDYDDIVVRNCSDLNHTLSRYSKTLKEWMDSL